MRVRNTFILVTVFAVGILALTPLVIGEALEPNENTMTTGGYLLVQCVVLVFAFAGAFMAHVVRRPTWYGLTLYMVGNFVVMLALTIAIAIAAVGTTVGEHLDRVTLLPFGWFMLVAFRWNIVKNPKGVSANLRTQDAAMHGEGNATTKPLSIRGGMVKVQYVFKGGDVTGCEIFVASADEEDAERRSVIVPEEAEGEASFVLWADGVYVFDVRGVNSAGESLKWNLEVEEG